jgi:signal transduction histidine kinase
MLSEREWPDGLVRRLEVSAEVFGSALMHRRFARLLDESRGFGTTLFASMQGQAAVLDRRGVILAVNEAWAKAVRGGRSGAPPALVGTSCLDACRAAHIGGEQEAENVVAGIVDVLEGVAPRYSVEYRVGAAEGERWLEMLAEPLRRANGGAVLTVVDITHRKRVEAEAVRLRDDLAHVSRVSTLGQLAASLAHELNQPLAAILSNAQAAQKLLARPSPDLDEIREILTDVVEDDKRAGDVIRGLREFFQKGHRDRAPVDLNELSREVTRLVQHDVTLRGASIRTHLRAELPLIDGDSIQLQQVVLNLMVNGLDAMRDLPSAQSVLTIRSGLEQGMMWIEVADTGRGIAEADRERLFQPFFTTKTTGIGMGLVIARSIMTAHGGDLSLVDPGPGAVFRMTIPTISSAAQ